MGMNRKNWLLVAALSMLALFATGSSAALIDKTTFTRCFEFSIETPEAYPFWEKEPTEIGCYILLPEEELVYVLSKEGINPLLAALYNEETRDLRHFSMAYGKTKKINQTNYFINPLPIPSSLHHALASERNLGEKLINDKLFDNDELNKLYKSLRANEQIIFVSEQENKNILKQEDFVEEFYLPDDLQPTAGYWWPHVGRPLFKDEWAPLSKYDNYVKAVAGFNPNTVAWESKNHATNVEWAGHCNGWVSSSILYKYEDVDLYDARNNVTITSSDLQGLRSVNSYCTSNAFYGRRYWGSGNDPNDIYPEQFHRLLIYYLKGLNKPVAFDWKTYAPVDNNIISGYRFEFESQGANKYLVKADIRAHRYSDGEYVHEREIAEVYTKTYWYYLWADSDGRFLRGEWVNPDDHPDFMWVPVSQAKCGRENPNLDERWIDHMLNNLAPIASDGETK